MSRLSVLALVVALGCGGKSTPPPTTPLPEDKPAVAPPADTKPAEPPPPPAAGPVSVDLEQAAPTVKLVNGGTGKKTVLAYGGTSGTSPVTITFDFREDHKAPAELGGDGSNGMPTITMNTEAQATVADGINYVLTLKSSDVTASPYGESKVPVDELKTALATLENFKISGAIAKTGVPSGAVKIETSKGDDVAKQIINLMQIALPSFPVLPAEAIGAKAKWQSTSTTKIMGQVDVTITTDWQLVSRVKDVAKVKGVVKVTGTEQSKGSSKLTNIKGSGTIEGTLTATNVFPEYVSKLETSFDVVEGDKKVQLAVKLGGSMKAGAAVAAAAPAADAAAPAPAAPAKK